MSDSWIERQLAKRAQQVQQVLPPGLVPGRQGQPGYPMSPAPQAYGQQPPVTPGAQSYGAPTGQQQSQVDPTGMSAYQRAAYAAMQAGRPEPTEACPECHQNTLYRRNRGENGMPLRIEASPECTNCGWPRLQSSSLHGALYAAKPTGRPKDARQIQGKPVIAYDATGRPMEVFEPQANPAGGVAYV